MSTRDSILSLRQAIGTVVIGQEAVVDRLVMALLANGNVLMEGLPGLAKTRAIKALAKNIESEFRRIQFTPDLLPSDVTGSEVYFEEAGSGRFQFQPGPVFGNLVLADEINRAPAKVQAALLEAMEERQVTVSGKTHPLPPLFMVLATQNPIEQEGTYPLPEAQMDRFLLHVVISHPSDADELKILRLVRSEDAATAQAAPPPALSQEILFAARKEVLAVKVSDAVEKYIVALIGASRRPESLGEKTGGWIRIGASPRGTLALDRASRALAWMRGRDHVLPDDVRDVAPDCLRHRLILTYRAHAEGVTPDEVIAALVKQVAVA